MSGSARRERRAPHHNDLGQYHSRHDRLGWGKSHHVEPWAPNGGRPEADWPFGGDVPPLEDDCPVPCMPDDAYYKVDDFNRTVAAPQLVSGGAASLSFVERATFGEEYDYLGGVSRAYFRGISSSWLTGKIGTTSGTANAAWTGRPSWSPCRGHSFTIWGARHVEWWHRYQLNALNGDAAYLQFNPTLKGTSFSAGKTVAVRFSLDTPASLLAGTVVATYVCRGDWLSDTVLVRIPVSLLPAAGGTFWVGFATVEHAQLGKTTCGFRFPAQLGTYGDWKAESNSFFSWTWTWLEWDVAASEVDYGSGTAHDGGSFAGGLPWSATVTGGAVITMDGKVRVTTAGGVGTARLEMASAATADVDPEGADAVGDAWTDADGVRMQMAFHADVLGSAAVGPTRYVRLGWGDGDEDHQVTVMFPSSAGGSTLEVQSAGFSESVAVTVAADTWYWLSLDTRNPEYTRAKLWVAAGQEPAVYTVDLYKGRAVEDEADVAAAGDSLFIEVGVGDGTTAQVISMNEVGAVVASADRQWVQERLGVADGSATRFVTAEPYWPHSLTFYSDGLHVAKREVDPYVGSFEAVQRWPSAEDAVVFARYIVRRDDGEEDEE